MARFEYLEARTLRQAISLLKKHGEGAQVVAGTTDFLVRWRQGFWKPSYVLSISRIPGLSRVSYGPRTGLRLGSPGNTPDSGDPPRHTLALSGPFRP